MYYALLHYKLLLSNLMRLIVPKVTSELSGTFYMELLQISLLNKKVLTDILLN